MDTMNAADAATFEEHLLVCGECWATVEVVAEYVRAIRTAAERMRTEPDAR
jgi:hypothetical protein